MRLLIFLGRSLLAAFFIMGALQTLKVTLIVIARGTHLC